MKTLKLAAVFTAGIFTLLSCSHSSGGSSSGGGNGNGGTVSGAVSGSSVFISGRNLTISNLIVSDHEVTQAEFEAVMGTNPSGFKSNVAAGEIQAKRPVERVNWYMAIAYCNKKSIADNLTPCYAVENVNFATLTYSDIPITNNAAWNAATCNWNANGYRLPTEAEWEYYARGGNVTGTQKTYSGSDNVGDVAWCSGNSSTKTHEVKKKDANALGLYDMSGNVCEWCWDWYDENGITADTPATGALSGPCRVVRGGYYRDDVVLCSVARRGCISPYICDDRFGFRVVRSAQ